MEGEKGLQQTKEKRPKDDILNIVKEFISYFEETDRSEEDDNSIKRS